MYSAHIHKRSNIVVTPGRSAIAIPFCFYPEQLLTGGLDGKLPFHEPKYHLAAHRVTHQYNFLS